MKQGLVYYQQEKAGIISETDEGYRWFAFIDDDPFITAALKDQLKQLIAGRMETLETKR